MYSSRRFGRTLTSMRASSSTACRDTIRSGCLCCIIRFAVPSAIVSAAHTPNSQSGLNGAQRAAPPQRQRATRRGRYDLLARSMTAMRRAANSRNSPRLLRASLRPRRLPRRVRRIPGSPARTPRPPRFPRATTALVSRSPRPRLPACLSTRPPCAPPSCAPRREFSSNARGRSRESPARVLRRSSPTGSSAPASAPRRKPKAASQKNAFPARRQIRIAPAHLPAHGCGSRGSLRCANRRARRTWRAAPARGSPRRPRQRAPDSVFFRRAVREAGQSSFASIAAFPSPVNATPRVQILTNQQVASRKRNRTYAVINPARKVASRSSSLGEKDMAQTNVQSTSHSTTISERAEMKPLTPNLNSLRAARPMASRKLMNTPNSPCTNPLPKTSLSVSGGCSNITGAPQSLRAMTRCSRSESSAAVFSNQFGLGKDVALHGAFNVGLRRAGFQTQFCVERIQLEEIAVRLAGRRTRPAVADLAEIVSALPRAAGKLFMPRHPLRKFLCVLRNVVQNPVYPGSRGGVGIIHDERKALRLCRRFIPFQLRGDVRSVARNFFRDRFARRKVRTRNLQRHSSSFRLREELSGSQRGDAK